MEDIIVEKNGKIVRQKKWLIALIAIACALLIAAIVLLCVFLNREEEPTGGGNSVLTGITASFNADYETLNGSERLTVYHLKAGEKYEFTVRPTQRGSNQIVLCKTGVKVYYDDGLLVFDEGEYLEGDGREDTITNDFPFYFTCKDAPVQTEIFVTAAGYWCKVYVIIEN